MVDTILAEAPQIEEVVRYLEVVEPLEIVVFQEHQEALLVVLE